jgi:hypothetical protein
MALSRVRLPCPACGKPIALSLRKAAQYDFQVGCIECKTVSYAAELLGRMKANDAAPHNTARNRSRSTDSDRAK